MQFNSRELIGICPLLKNTPKGVFRAMSSAFESTVHSAHEPILYEGETPLDEDPGLFFIQSGVAEVLAKSWDGSVDFENAMVIADIGEGSYFGECALIFKTARVASMRAQSILICYTLRERQLHQVLKNYPYVLQYIGTIARKRLERVERLSQIAQSQDKRVLRTEIIQQDPDEEDQQTEYWKSNHRAKRAKSRWQNAGRKTNLLKALHGAAQASQQSGEDEKSPEKNSQKWLALKAAPPQNFSSKRSSLRTMLAGLGQRGSSRINSDDDDGNGK